MASGKAGNTGLTVAAECRERDQQSQDAALDWHILRTAHPNVLVTGPADAVEQSLAVLMPHLDAPVCYWTAEAALPSPGDMKTLVIRHLEALSVEQQRHLASWLEQATVLTALQVVSTTTGPLFQRVAAGLFLDVLYYRLNSVMLDARFTTAYPRPQPARADVRTASVPAPLRDAWRRLIR